MEHMRCHCLVSSITQTQLDYYNCVSVWVFLLLLFIASFWHLSLLQNLWCRVSCRPVLGGRLPPPPKKKSVTPPPPPQTNFYWLYFLPLYPRLLPPPKVLQLPPPQKVKSCRKSCGVSPKKGVSETFGTDGMFCSAHIVALFFNGNHIWRYHLRDHLKIKWCQNRWNYFVSLSLNPPPPPKKKRLKNIHIWHNLLFGIKHKGIKGFKQNLRRDIHL